MDGLRSQVLEKEVVLTVLGIKTRCMKEGQKPILREKVNLGLNSMKKSMSMGESIDLDSLYGRKKIFIQYHKFKL